MTTLTVAIVLTSAAGAAIPLGGLISTNDTLRSFCLHHEIDSFILYFGGGALLAAIALVLIPYGMEHNSVPEVVIAFLLGSILLWQVDSYLKRKGNTVSVFMGMLLDYIPESIVLGAVMTTSAQTGYLLAVLIALQNMPEGFAALIEMRESRMSATKIWALFLAAPAVGPLSAWLGYAWLTGSSSIIGLLCIFCSGGILYLIFDDIAPNAHVKYHDFPAIGAVFGFLLGMVGTMVIH
jgi:ZIP family zinc transporter